MKNDNLKKQRTRCMVYSRVVGWLTPLHNWNNGKKAEFEERKVFKINEKSYANNR